MLGNRFEIAIDYRFIIGRTKPTSYRLCNRFNQLYIVQLPICLWADWGVKERAPLSLCQLWISISNNATYMNIRCNAFRKFYLHIYCSDILKKMKKKKRTRAFNAWFWPQILLKNKFWNLVEKTIPKNSHMSPLLKTRTSTSFILQALPWQRPEEP